MTDGPVIQVQNLSKAYPLYARPTDMLKEFLFGGIRHDVFWALRNVSLSVASGQRVGIVGANGAGKSTLLKIIAGNLQPTSGSVAVNGTVSALLSLVPAWSLEQTGLENIRFNLMLRGCDRKTIRLLTDEIVDFAELGPFISQPVKTYSAGMSARLSFAIATSISPEILIVDEVLGAGDGYFAAKAAARMKQMCDRGKALLFVSHSTAAIQQMCDTAVWMEHGSIRLAGSVDYVLRQYELDFRRAEDETTRAKNQRAAEVISAAASPDDLVSATEARFRILPADGGRFTSSHFIRSISVAGVGTTAMDVSLDALERESAATLDMTSSEWGRLHERAGHTSRLLARAHGRRPGGHFIVQLPAKDAFSATVTIDSVSDADDELLALEYLDASSGQWMKAVERSRQSVNGWTRSVFTAELQVPDAAVVEEVRTRVAEAVAPKVRIADVSFLVGDLPATSVPERGAFTIRISLEFRGGIEDADVGLKLTRTDGVYVFWQSAGLVANNLHQPTGPKHVDFRFDDHVIGAGEYIASVYVSDGWQYPDNYPYAEVFARSVEALRFRVTPELKGVDFGVVNLRVPVTIE